MDLLTPSATLEALVFRCSATLVGSTWTWLAVVFTALGFWRIRAVGFSKTPLAGPTEHRQQPQAPEPTTVGPQICHVEEGDCSVPKVRFTAYYSLENNNGPESTYTPKLDGTVFRETRVLQNTRRHVSCRYEDLINVLERRGDLGWYRHQDWSVFNGSVVRLWHK